MIPLAGYSDRLSVRPGETIRFHVANATGAEVSSRLVRVNSADPNPAGPGIRTEPITCDGLNIQEPVIARDLPRGSFALAGPVAPLSSALAFTASAVIWPTGKAGSDRSILGVIDPVGGGFGLGIDRKGRLQLALGVSASTTGGVTWRRVETPTPLEFHAWHLVWCSVDRTSGTILLGSLRLASGRPAGPPMIVTARAEEIAPVPLVPVTIAATASGQDPYRFDGKIERPMLFDRALSADEIARAARGEAVAGLVAAWDFSQDMHTSRITDTGPHGFHGTLHNAPARAVRGSTWTGREQCFRHAPAQYAAIHFHSDDIDDCRWPVTHEYCVPVGLKSGAYALMLEARGETENIPFFVVPPKGRPASKLAVLVSTFTYTVYGNHARPEWGADPNWREAWIKQSREWGAYPHNPGAHAEYGLSTYNHHSDGSGICMASWHRPMLNLRIGYLTYPYPEIRGSGLRHYPADSHLLAWLDAKGFAYDLITDWELHHEGHALLKDYTCVMTGSHPEYHTGAMLDALEAYTHGGGRFMYMGGNGFYWKIALSPEKPGLIEIRRAEGGIRAWAAEPGEYYNQFDGEYGGLWRRNARPPQQLVGVGFTAQGNFVGSYYRVTPGARSDARTAWMLAGIDSDIIGDFGLSGHGAAGFELDRTDVRLGTPAHAVVIARSEKHPPEAPWVLVPEEQLTHLTTFPGASHKELIRADMTFFETPNNGAVFSTGSITFCGSLPVSGFNNPVSRLSETVLRRFLDPAARFPVPGRA